MYYNFLFLIECQSLTVTSYNISILEIRIQRIFDVLRRSSHHMAINSDGLVYTMPLGYRNLPKFRKVSLNTYALF